MKKVLYIGWVGFKNLGDELMLDLFKEQLLPLGESYTLDAANIEYRFLKNVRVKEYDLIVLGGGSIFGGGEQLVSPYVINFLNDCLLLNKKVMIWGTGIDWAPKEYIKLLDENKEIPLSISPSFQTKVEKVFNESVWSGIRGPLTFKILEHYGAKKCHISGDSAFLLDPSTLSNEDVVELEPNLKEKKIIGVNWGTSFNNIYGGDELKVEEQLVNALNELIEKGYYIYLYTVWKTDLPAINRLYSKLIDPHKVTLDQTLYNHNQLLSLMQHFTFTINFKLHANYISLAANTPFIALGYRFKMFDFVKSVNLEDYIIATDEQNISEQILTMETNIINNQSTIKANMENILSIYREKMKQPFESGLYL